MANGRDNMTAEKLSEAVEHEETRQKEGLHKTNGQGLALVPQPSDDPLDPLVCLI
jgi:hypothetical protein